MMVITTIRVDDIPPIPVDDPPAISGDDVSATRGDITAAPPGDDALLYSEPREWCSGDCRGKYFRDPSDDVSVNTGLSSDCRR